MFLGTSIDSRKFVGTPKNLRNIEIENFLELS